MQTIPAGDFTATAKVMLNAPKFNYFNFGICLYNSANGTRIIFGPFAKEHFAGIQAIKFASDYGYASDPYLLGGWDYRFAYVRARIVGTSYYLDVSKDGDFFWPAFSESIASFFSAISHIGIGYSRNNGNGVTYKGRCDWFRVIEP